MGRRAKEPHLIRPHRQLKERRSLPRLLQERQGMPRVERLVHLVCRELLAFSVDLDRDPPVEQLVLVDRVVLDRVVEVRDLADPGRIDHRVSIRLVPKKACARVPDRTQLVRPWDRDLRDRRWAKVKLVRKVIVRRDSSVGRVLIEDRVLIGDRDRIVGRDLRVPKELEVIVRRDLKVLRQVIVRRDPKVLAIDRRDRTVVNVSSADRVLIGDRDRIIVIVGHVPKVEGRKEELLKVELLFRRPNPRHRNKRRNRLHRRPQSPRLLRRSLRRVW